jgi:nucleotide-binding universal stress UspA family protein
MKPIHTILCPVDFSPGSSAAADYAVGLARALGARVHLLHVDPLPILAVPDGGIIVTPEMLARMNEASTKAIEELAAQLGGAGGSSGEAGAGAPRPAPIETFVCEGSPHVEILRRAEKIGADLIVMGTHGRSGFAHLLLGSVAEKVVRTAPIPVLTVRLEAPS